MTNFSLSECKMRMIAVYDLVPVTKFPSVKTEEHHLGCARHGVCFLEHFLLRKLTV